MVDALVILFVQLLKHCSWYFPISEFPVIQILNILHICCTSFADVCCDIISMTSVIYDMISLARVYCGILCLLMRVLLFTSNRPSLNEWLPFVCVSCVHCTLLLRYGNYYSRMYTYSEHRKAWKARRWRWPRRVFEEEDSHWSRWRWRQFVRDSQVWQNSIKCTYYVLLCMCVLLCKKKAGLLTGYF